MIAVFDIETDGLLDTLTKIHCASLVVVRDLVAPPEVWKYRPSDIPEFLNTLGKSEVICGHNVIGFDIPAIHLLYPEVHLTQRIFDTLVVARTLYPDRPQGHSLKSYGPKDTFGETTDWSEFSEDMMTYCAQDATITYDLLVRQLRQLGISLDELRRIDLWRNKDA